MCPARSACVNDLTWSRVAECREPRSGWRAPRGPAGAPPPGYSWPPPAYPPAHQRSGKPVIIISHVDPDPGSGAF